MKLTACGNCCDECKAYRPNIERLDEREALSAAWRKYLGFDLKPQDIHCEGGHCCAAGLGFTHEGCRYKPCTAEHGVSHCGQCPEFPCDKFDDDRNTDEAHMREKLGDTFIKTEYDAYVKVFDNRRWVSEYSRAMKECKAMTMCGYRCDLCKAYSKNIAVKDERAELSRVWEKYYSLHIPPEDILCDGCRCMEPGAQLVDAACPVRACVLEKGLLHCGECADYPCPVFEARTGLSAEDAAQRLPDGFGAEEYGLYMAAYDNRTRLNGWREMFYNE